jgi:hypothetical protein
MNKVVIHLPQEIYHAVWSHLLPARFRNEEVGFVYVRPASANKAQEFEFVDWDPIQPQGFLARSRYGFELTDESRARVIKHAHDLGTSLVEIHSHAGSWSAAFSASDLIGLAEFLPHVWWRLQGKPYFAVVVTRKSFDGLAWLTGPDSPQRLDGIAVGETFLIPTKLSALSYDTYDTYGRRKV